MLLAEAPGEAEDRLGEPMVGPAGKKLDELLAQVPLGRDEVWIDNRVHCRPPKNSLRDYPNALTVCTNTWLDAIIADVQPKVIVCLGKVAGSLWFGDMSIYDMQELQRVLPGGLTIIGSRHPAAILHGEKGAAGAIVSSLRRAKEIVG